MSEATDQLDQKTQLASMPQNWSVTVTVNGQDIVSIGQDWLSGNRPLEAVDEQTIIGAAQHLLSFVGYGLPPCDYDQEAPASPVVPATANSRSENEEVIASAESLAQAAQQLIHEVNAEREVASLIYSGGYETHGQFDVDADRLDTAHQAVSRSMQTVDTRIRNFRECEGRPGVRSHRDSSTATRLALAGVQVGAIGTSTEAAAAEHHGLDTSDIVCFYEQDFYVLSNFSSFRLRWCGVDFPTSEHAYHWEKFRSRIEGESNDERYQRASAAASVRFAPSAHEAFKIAERCKSYRRRDWDDVKVDIMRALLRAKAEQHEYVRRKLLATGNRELVENSWRDGFWGWGANQSGENMLGKLWMEIRSELRAAELVQPEVNGAALIS